MNIIFIIQHNRLLEIIIISLLGASIGSFLNVVIYRLPQILYHRDKSINLMMPHSFCPQCKHTISWQHNLPLLSFLLLRGKCAYCQHRISLHYFIVELSCVLLSVFLAFYYSFNWQFLGSLLFTWSLIPLVVIDVKTQLLPDEITLPLLWLGLIFNLFTTFTQLKTAVIGAISGYLTLWAITHVYRLFTKKQAMGHGDFKLLAAIGAWLGWQLLPFVIFIASVLGIICGLFWLHISRQPFNTAIAFGPYLAIAAWFVLIFNKDFFNWYFTLLG